MHIILVLIINGCTCTRCRASFSRSAVFSRTFFTATTSRCITLYNIVLLRMNDVIVSLLLPYILDHFFINRGGVCYLYIYINIYIYIYIYIGTIRIVCIVCWVSSYLQKTMTTRLFTVAVHLLVAVLNDDC